MKAPRPSGMPAVRVRQAGGRDDAFTLVELLVSVAILGFVLGVVFLLLTSVSQMADRLSASGAATDEVRQATDVMTRELRMAQGWGETTPVANWQWALYPGNAQDRRLSFWADVDRDGTRELVTYKTATTSWGTSLVRTVTELSGATSLGAEGSPRVLVRSLATSTPDPIFGYYNESRTLLSTGGGTGSLDTASEIPYVIAVDLDVTAAATGNYSTSGQTATIDNLVRLRSARTALGY